MGINRRVGYVTFRGEIVTVQMLCLEALLKLSFYHCYTLLWRDQTVLKDEIKRAQNK